MSFANNPRQLAFMALNDIYRRDAYVDIALDRVLAKANPTNRDSLRCCKADRALTCELVYGTVRMARSLDALISSLGSKPTEQQALPLRIILQLGLYQLRYLNQIPQSAAVNTSVELAKQNGLKNLAGVVNALLRKYLRLTVDGDPLIPGKEPSSRIGILYSFPDWIVQNFIEQFGTKDTEELCAWFNLPPHIDLRVNLLKTTVAEVSLALQEAGAISTPLPYLPQSLRLINSNGAIQNLPGFDRAWWMVQDGSAQLVTHLLAPQPGETIIDACAAPGGKTTHIAELMQDRGTIWAIDRDRQRLKKVRDNSERLQLNSIKICHGDSRELSQFKELADRVLLDAPCSGLGTLNKHPDIRWRQNPERIADIVNLQKELLAQTATWVKPGGILLYSTCTLNKLENEEAIAFFLNLHPDWQIEAIDSIFASPPGWVKILPQIHQMDGFFIAKLKKRN